jgi:hypothetical protein
MPDSFRVDFFFTPLLRILSHSHFTQNSSRCIFTASLAAPRRNCGIRYLWAEATLHNFRHQLPPQTTPYQLYRTSRPPIPGLPKMSNEQLLEFLVGLLVFALGLLGMAILLRILEQGRLKRAAQAQAMLPLYLQDLDRYEENLDPAISVQIHRLARIEARQEARQRAERRSRALQQRLDGSLWSSIHFHDGHSAERSDLIFRPEAVYFSSVLNNDSVETLPRYSSRPPSYRTTHSLA